MREGQLQALVNSTARLLDQVDELETELEEKDQESAAAVRAQQTAEHELSLCAVPTT